MTAEELKVYLPRYLSKESFRELIQGLKDFPGNLDERIYTNYLVDERNIFQGDCISELPIVNVESLSKKNVSAIILSNTCDLDERNERLYSTSIAFSPVVKLNNYIEFLRKDQINEEKIEAHLKAIKNQSITQILYLPSYGDSFEESIVFLDKLYNIPSSMIEVNDLKARRIFTLSDYGFYLFLFKLSLHFTRIQDKVDRKSVRLN